MKMFLSRVAQEWSLIYGDGRGFFLSVSYSFHFLNDVTVLHIPKEDEKANLKTKK